MKMQECGNARLRNARMKNDKTAPFSSRRRVGDEVNPGENARMRRMQECGNARRRE